MPGAPGRGQHHSQAVHVGCGLWAATHRRCRRNPAGPPHLEYLVHPCGDGLLLALRPLCPLLLPGLPLQQLAALVEQVVEELVGVLRGAEREEGHYTLLPVGGLREPCRSAGSPEQCMFFVVFPFLITLVLTCQR